MANLQAFQWRRWQWLLALFLSTMLLIMTLPTLASGAPQQDLQRLDTHIEQALTKAEAKDLQGAKAAYNQFDQSWFDIEDGVKETSRQAYKEIEGAMEEVKFAFSAQPPAQPQVVESLKKLHTTDQKFIMGGFQQGQTVAPNNRGKITIATLLERLNRAEVDLNSNNTAAAAEEMKGFEVDWLEVEGVVATKSKQAYVDTENNMAKAYGFLEAHPADVTGAKTAIAALKQDLQPYAGEGLHYNLFDATLILLREGMEALLVVIALLAFLNKSGNGDKSRWIWMGAGIGILASIATALIIQVIFSNLAAGGVNRELLEGCTSLFAAVMLFYVSYWLHSKSSLGAWQGYIKGQVTSALAKNSLFSLAFLAFLAVFREGGETVLFYIGIAPSISPTDLLGGLALGSVLLVAIAALMLGFGLRIPLKPFFLITSLLIYYLGFKFVGGGIHSLQVAGILPDNPANFLPTSETFGLYPTWETTLPQMAVLLMAVAVVIYTQQKSAPVKAE